MLHRWRGLNFKEGQQEVQCTTIEFIPTDPALQADPMSEIKQTQEAADKAKAGGEQAAVDMFQL
jgi:hypothetical protein